MKTTAVPNVNDDFNDNGIDIDCIDSSTIDNEKLSIDINQVSNSANDNDNYYREELAIRNLNLNVFRYYNFIMKQSVNMLIHKRERWETNENFKSTQMLYEILSETMELFCALRDDDINSVVVRISFDIFAKNMGLKFSNKRHYIHRVLIVVFGKYIERERMAKYIEVLKSALADDVQPEKLATYITRFYGIEYLCDTDSKMQSAKMS